MNWFYVTFHLFGRQILDCPHVSIPAIVSVQEADGAGR